MADYRADVLVAAAVELVRLILKDEEDFIPFGMILPQGESSAPNIVAYYDGEQIGDDHAAILSRTLREQLAGSGVCATILVLEGVRRPAGGAPTDTMLCRIDMNGADSLALVIPYARHANGEITLEEIESIPMSRFPIG